MFLRQLSSRDRIPTRDFIFRQWGAETVVVHDTLYHPTELPGFLIEQAGHIVGLVTYLIAGGGCEIVTLNSLAPKQGHGSALIEAVRSAAEQAGCRRLWLVTTNDNLYALRFYQRRGFRIVKIDQGAVDRSRIIKPEIPLIGYDGIPIRDEIELELILNSGA